jgi:predicted TIM-barrel fold metal-dependent hydrolase
MKQQSDTGSPITRRSVVSSSAILLAESLAGAQSLAKPTRLIDVHHHHMPPHLIEVMKMNLIAGGSNTPPAWTPQSALEGMDQYGIETAMLSISQGVEMASAEQTASLCRECNDYGAKLVTDKPVRFGLFASLPLPAVDTSLKEIEYALDHLHADGIGLMSHYGDGLYIGQPEFTPILAELNRRKAVVFVHPKDPFYQIRGSGSPPNPIRFPGGGIGELPFDTTRAIQSLMATDVTGRFPDIKFIFPHGGGVIPFLASRVALLGSRTKGFAAGSYDKVTKALATFYYDLTNTIEPPCIAAVKAIAPTSRLLFGTDVPYGDGPREHPGLFVGMMLDQLPRVGFKSAELTAIARGNGEVLFPRLKQRNQTAQKDR